MLRRTLSITLLSASFLIAGCGGGGTSSSNPPPPSSPALTITPTSLAFSGTAVGSTSAAQTVTLVNTGGATLTISSLVLSDTSNYKLATNTCGASLIAGAGCSLGVTSTPTSATPPNASITVTDNASNSPQTIGLSSTTGSGSSPTLTLSATMLTFPSTTLGQTSASQTLTLTNTGTATLTLSSYAATGNTADFTDTTTCSTSLAVNASCAFTIVFVPQATGTRTATITITDNASNSPQAVTLTGTGASASSTVTRTLLTFPAAFPDPLPDASVAALYALINNAQSTIDMTMYELQDTTFTGDLVSACARGVKVRVILSSSEKSSNTPAYTQLSGAGNNCSAVLSNTAFTNTHQKTITVDGTTTAIMSLNLQTQYYSTTRDFALIENDAADIAAIEATFNMDYAAGTPYGGNQGASDFSYQPTAGDTTVFPAGDLIWSPTTAQVAMLGIINNAKTSLLIENEEMSAPNIVSALEAACRNGVMVHITMVNSSTSSPYSDYATNFKALEAAGCGVHTFADTATGLYIHAKAVVADYGLSTQNVYMGSINYSTASMNANRELGMYLSDTASVQTLYTTLTNDYANPLATPF